NPENIFNFLKEKYLDKINAPNEKSSVGKQFDNSKHKVKHRKIEKKLNDGRTLIIYSTSNKPDDFNIGDKVTIDGLVPEDGNYHYGWTGGITIRNGLIKW